MNPRRMSFRVIDGGGEVRHEPPPSMQAPVGLYIVGAVVLSWCFAVGVVWTAYTVCIVTGLCRP